jgi:AAA+ superfamily predicted ATPase
MGIEDFIRDALHQPHDYVAYHVARELAELHPEKTVLEGRNWEFDLEGFVRAGKCSVVEQRSVFHHTRSDWDGVAKKLRPRIENAWLNVLWNGELLDVVLISWAESCYRIRHQWIVADQREVAEKFYDAVCEWGCEARGEIVVFQDGYFQKSKELFDSIQSTTFDNLILRDSLKRQIQTDFAQFFSARETYERYGIPWRRGSIFIGPPGNGKTHTVKALINSLDQPCLYVRSFKEGGTEQENIADVFKRARMSPCVVVLEDLDAMIHDQNRAFFLNELDGFQTNSGVAVLATTNHPEKLDTAILDRPSRFDRKYYFELPGEAERRAYVQKWNGELQAELRFSGETVSIVVKKTEGFSFAYLKELFVASLAEWMSAEGKTPMDEVVLGQVKLLRGQTKRSKEGKGSKPDKKKEKKSGQ